MTFSLRRAQAANRTGRRRAVLRRRLLEAGTGWLLAILVLGSVGLGAMLWSGALWSATPIVAQVPLATPTYVGPDDVTERTLQDVVSPERILLLYPGYSGDVALGPATGTSGADFLPVWTKLQSMLAGQQTHIGSSSTTGLKVLMRAMSVYSATPPDAGGAGLEADLGPVLTWSEWLGAAEGTAVPAPHDDPSFERLIVLPEHSGACGTVSAALYLVDGALVRWLPVSASAYAPLCQTITDLRYLTPDGYPLMPLDSQLLSKQAAQAVADPAGLLVPNEDTPAMSGWQPGRLRYETWDLNQAQAQALALSLFFPDQPWRHGDRNFTTPEGDALQIDPVTGRALAVFRQAEGQLPGWVAALDASVRFINAKGGWPPTAWLSGARSGYLQKPCNLVNCPPPDEVTFSFSTRFNGLPVLSPDSRVPPALTIRMSGTPAHPIQYSRMVPSLSSPAAAADGADAGSPPPVGPEAAINIALRYPPPELSGNPGQPLLVTGIMPTYVPLPGSDVLEPAWAVELDLPAGGTPIVMLIDAMNRAVLGEWSPD